MENMLSFKFESGCPDFSDSSDGELLRDIEEINKALYVENQTHEKSLISFSNFGPKSAKYPHFDKGSEYLKEEEQKHSSIWGWRPFKALSHIRRKKFTCYFFCHVHCIENLMLDLNDISMSVIWMRKDNALRTLPSRVSNRVVEFEETLMSKCTVYGSRNGPRDFVKYEPKHFLLYVSIVGAEGVKFGKHWVELTRLLPLTLEELEQDKCSGKWSTSFQLMGNAKGATLHVSFGYLIKKDGLAELGSSVKPPLVLSLDQNGLSRINFPDSSSVKTKATLRRAGSVPSSLTNASCYSPQCLDAKIGLPKDICDFSNSVNKLYGKLEKRKNNSATKFDMVSESLESPQSVPVSVPNFSEPEHDDEEEFAVIEKGVESEFCQEEARKLDESLAKDSELSSVEIIDVSEIFQDEQICSDICSDEKTKIDIMDEAVDCVAIGTPIHKHSAEDTKESNLEEEALLALHKMLISQTDEIELSVEKNSAENKVNKGNNLIKSLSLDDLAKSVADDFCNLLEDLRTPSSRNYNFDLESPRERLLRQFEEDMITSGSHFFDVDIQDDIIDMSAYDFAASSVSSSDNYVESVDFSNETVQESSRSKLKAKSLERLETQTLMERWGLNEEAFQSSAYYSSGGFGSPISVPPEEPVGLPSLAEGVGPLLRLKNGGCLRSMSSLLFSNAKNSGGLIIQTSKAVVLPRELGSDVMEILQCLASVGSERLSKKVHSLLPLEDLSGKVMQQLALEASYEAEVLERPEYSQHKYDIKIELELHPYFQSRTYFSSNSTDSGFSSEYVAASDLPLLALDTMEALMIEGLKIQSGMPEQDAPSSIRVKGTPNNVNELLDLSISLDEWLRAQEKSENSENESMKYEFLRDDLTLALMLQLRDPLRNYEPVGGLMLGLVQVKRLIKPMTQSSEDDNKGEGMILKFRLDEVHVAGLNAVSDKFESWSSKKQQQSGSRWLLASGLTKNGNSRFSKSKSIIKMPTLMLKKPWARSLIWSISHSIQEVRIDSQNQHTRNPDVEFPQVTV